MYLACQWTDEQTGGHCADLAQHFTGTKRKWFTFTNGVHADSLDPATFTRWYDFLELYVAQVAPRLSATDQGAGPDAVPGGAGNPRRDAAERPDSVRAELRRARWPRSSGCPQIRILFDNGAGSSTPGAPVPAFEQSFSRFPIPGTRASPGIWRRRRARLATAGEREAPDSSRGTPTRCPRPTSPATPASAPGGLWTATAPVPVGAEPAGHGAVVRERAAGREHRRRRRRGGAGMDQGLGSERRPPGDGLGGPARRQGDVRAVRVAASQRAQARRLEHAARSRCRRCARPMSGRCRGVAGPRSRSRCITRATSTGAAPGSGS